MAISLEQLRARSTAAFGQSYRLEVMLAVAESTDRRVCLSDLARELDLTTSNVQKPLRALIDVGLLSGPISADLRKKMYTRIDSPAWDWAYQLSGLKPGRALGQLRRMAGENES